MLKDYLEKRYTARWWDDKKVESEKLNYILETTYLAPSKQGAYDYTIVVVKDTPTGKEFKEWLHDNTWCINGIRGKEGPGLRVYNGQVLAPILFVYLSHVHPTDVGDINNRNKTDCIVSATIAMCAAEEQGLSTGFCTCLNGLQIANKLNYSNMLCQIVVGIGYATTDLKNKRGLYDKNGVLYGVDRSNTDPKLKLDTNRTTKRKFLDFYKEIL